MWYGQGSWSREEEAKDFSGQKYLFTYLSVRASSCSDCGLSSLRQDLISCRIRSEGDIASTRQLAHQSYIVDLFGMEREAALVEVSQIFD